MAVYAQLRQSARLLRGNIFIFCLTDTLGFFSRSLVFPYASLYILALGGQPEDIGLVNSLAPLAGLILFPIAGYISDRSGRVKLIFAAGLVSAGCMLLYVTAPVWQVLALAGILGSISVLQFPPSSAMIADSLTPEDRGRGLAAMGIFPGLPAILAPYLAGLILDRAGVLTGMRVLYGVMFLTMLSSAFIARRFLKETSPRRESAGIRVGELFRVVVETYRGLPQLWRAMPRSLRALAGVVTLCIMTNAISGPFWVVYAVEHIGLDSEQWGLILLVESMTRNLAYLFTGILVDRLGRTRCIIGALTLTLLVAPLFVLTTGFWGVLAVRIVPALATATFMPASAALMADLVPREERGRIMAAIGRGSLPLAASAGGFGGPGTGFLTTLPIMAALFSAGYLYNLGPKLPWLALAVGLLAALMLTVLYVRDPDLAHA